jgi:hypothetical protein
VTTYRQFTVAPSLARLIQRERGGERVLEGYFPDRPQQCVHVLIEEHRSRLVLTDGADVSTEEGTEIPQAHAQALLAVTSGQVDYIRTILPLGRGAVHLLHFIKPGPLNLAVVEFGEGDDQEYQPLAWFGPDVSGEPAYRRRRMALDGLPTVPEVDLTNEALNSLLDALENGSTPLPYQMVAEDLTPRPPALSVPSEPQPATDTDEEIDDLNIEDEVIRELARSLRPQGR